MAAMGPDGIIINFKIALAIIAMLRERSAASKEASDLDGSGRAVRRTPSASRCTRRESHAEG